MTSIPGLPARRAALTLLDAVLRRGQPLEAALTPATRGLDKGEDKALARAIASETLRRLPDLDALIDSATRQPLPDDAKARMVLRIALAQALILKTPEHAAVATALPLVEGGPRRLVHGVLGTLLRGTPTLPELPTLPHDVSARWSEAWGGEMVTLAQTALATTLPIDLTLRNPAETADWTARLEGESLTPGHVRVPRDTAIPGLPGFAEGAWWVQNLAASLPARLLGRGDGRRVLDLCAAPGGKTMQLAAAGWDVTAVDSHPARLDRVKENLGRTGLTATLVKGDLLHWQPKAPADAILLDAPCTATGIFARHPEVLHRVRAKDIAALAETQAAMLARCANWLTPEGTLIYATCSLEPQEGEAAVEAATAAGLALDPIANQELVGGIAAHPKGWVRIYPQFGCDGFFIARFRRG